MPVESTTVGYSPCHGYFKLSFSHRTMLWTLSLQKVDGTFFDVSPLVTRFTVAASTKEYDKVQLLVMRISVITAIVMFLKAHLKTL